MVTHFIRGLLRPKVMTYVLVVHLIFLNDVVERLERVRASLHILTISSYFLMMDYLRWSKDCEQKKKKPSQFISVIETRPSVSHICSRYVFKAPHNDKLGR